MIRILSLTISSLLLAACTQAPAPTVQPAPTAQAQARTAGSGEHQVKRGETLFRIAREHGLDHRELAALNNITDPTTLREGHILRLRPSASAESSSAASGVAVVSPVGVGAVVESRPLTGAAPAAVVSSPLREPRGGKEPYSDEAHARLNSQPAKATSAVTAEAPVATVAPGAAVPASTDKATTATVEGVVWAWPTTASIQRGYNVGGNKGIDFAGKQGDPVLAAAEGRVLYVGEALSGYGKLVIIKHGNDHLSVYAHNHRILVKESQAVKLGEKIAEKGRTGTDSVKLHFEIRKQGKPVDPMPFLPKR